MAGSTKTRILEAARQLFNEHGYSQVTMRQIADAVEISPGNLTYYFRRKADIVTTLMDESFDHTYLREPILTLADLLNQFRRMLETVQCNAFYFLDPEFADAPRAHNAILRQRILDGFAHLVESGVLDASFDEESRNAVLSVLLMAHMTWLRASVRSERAMSLDAFIELHQTILKPYLKKQA